MQPDIQPEPVRSRYTVVAEPVSDAAWHVTVRERRDIWTVAFAADEIEARARDRIALDTGLAIDAFDVELAPIPPLFLERRANRRG